MRGRAGGWGGVGHHRAWAVALLVAYPTVDFVAPGPKKPSAVHCDRTHITRPSPPSVVVAAFVRAPEGVKTVTRRMDAFAAATAAGDADEAAAPPAATRGPAPAVAAAAAAAAAKGRDFVPPAKEGRGGGGFPPGAAAACPQLLLLRHRLRSVPWPAQWLRRVSPSWP